MNKQEVIICKNLEEDLRNVISSHKFDKLFILTDNNTSQFCLPLTENIDTVKNATKITIGVEDSNKNLETLTHVWSELSNGGATRHSLLINLGGGMVTDLGGFAAATFKRGFPSNLDDPYLAGIIIAVLDIVFLQKFLYIFIFFHT